MWWTDRDPKPSNLRIDTQGEPFVLRFGLTAGQETPWIRSPGGRNQPERNTTTTPSLARIETETPDGRGLAPCSVLRIHPPHHPWEGDGLADVFDAAEPSDGALDAQAETAVGDAAVATQVQVPLRILLRRFLLLHAGEQAIEILLVSRFASAANRWIFVGLLHTEVAQLDADESVLRMSNKWADRFPDAGNSDGSSPALGRRR